MKVTEDEMNKKICDNCSLAAAVVQLASAKVLYSRQRGSYSLQRY